MKMINTMNLSDAAKDLYKSRYLYPNSKVSQRCLDFIILEKLAKEWETKNKHKNNKLLKR